MTTAYKKSVLIQLPTNINGKLSCDYMMHIDRAPDTGIPESYLATTLVKIRTADNSCPETMWQLVDTLRLTLKEISTGLTWMSHGMTYFEFISMYLTNNPHAKHDHPMCVYFYKKIHS